MYVADIERVMLAYHVQRERVAGKQLDVPRLVHAEAEMRKIFYLAALALDRKSVV